MIVWKVSGKEIRKDKGEFENFNGLSNYLFKILFSESQKFMFDHIQRHIGMYYQPYQSIQLRKIHFLRLIGLLLKQWKLSISGNKSSVQ